MKKLITLIHVVIRVGTRSLRLALDLPSTDFTLGKVHFMKAVSLILGFALLTIGTTSNAAPNCNKELFARTKNDQALTSIQKQAALDAACLNKVVTATGKIQDVDGISIDINTDDGLSYSIFLAKSHRCGPLVNLRKQQAFAATGLTTRVFVNSEKIYIENGDCR